MEKLTFTSSAFKHGFTKFDINNAVQYSISAKTINSKRVIAGWSLSGVIIEVFCQTCDNEYKVFHCSKITQEIRKVLKL